MKRKNKFKTNSKRNIRNEKIVAYSIGFLVIFLGLIQVTAQLLSGEPNNFYSAYMSTKGDCFDVSDDPNYVTAGMISVGNLSTPGEPTDLSPENIKIEINYAENHVIRHELCHLNQIVENRAYSCNNLIGVYYNEFECYYKKSDAPLTKQEEELLAKYEK